MSLVVDHNGRVTTPVVYTLRGQPDTAQVMRSTQLDNESNEPTDIERVRFTSLTRTLIRPLARSLASSLFRNRLTQNSPPKQPNTKQPPNFLSPLGRLMYVCTSLSLSLYIYIYIYTHIYDVARNVMAGLDTFTSGPLSIALTLK